MINCVVDALYPSPRRGVDLQRAGRIDDGAGEIRAVASAISDGSAVEVDGCDRQVSCVLSGGDCIAEGQRIAARATGISGGRTVIEGERRRAAGDGDRLAQVDGEGDDAADTQITGAVGNAGARGSH